MNRLIFFVLNALLALLSVVNAKDQIRLYAFTKDDCFGTPAGANIDIKRGDCQNIPNGARSVKPMIDDKRDGWVKDVNSGAVVCQVTTYKTLGCLEGQELDSVSVPKELNQCLQPDDSDDAVLSAKFECGADRPLTTMRVTSWQIGPDEKPTPIVGTTTHSITLNDSPSAAARSAEPSVDRLEPRSKKHHNSKGVWMFHPWSQSILCYECWTTKEDASSQVKCASGPKNVIDCGARPGFTDGEPITVTHSSVSSVVDPTVRTTTLYELTSTTLDEDPTVITTTSTSTITSISTSTSTSPSMSTTTTTTTTVQPVEKRSWHRRVTFKHPFKANTIVCSNAEWDSRGKAKAQILLEKIGEDLKKCTKAKAPSIDIPPPVHTTHWSTSKVTKWTQVIQTHTVYFGPDTTTDEEEGFAMPAHKDL